MSANAVRWIQVVIALVLATAATIAVSTCAGDCYERGGWLTSGGVCVERVHE